MRTETPARDWATVPRTHSRKPRKAQKSTFRQTTASHRRRANIKHENRFGE